jgi:hypothetical protein
MNSMTLSSRNCISTASILIVFIIGKSCSLLITPTIVSFSSSTQTCSSYRPLASATKLHAASDDKNNSKYDDNDNDSAGGNQTNINSKSLQEKMDAFLDTPFFDPDQILDDKYKGSQDRSSSDERSLSNPLLVWFANLVKNDYQTAEALYTAAFISIMVVFAQELLRMVKYGDAYHPFQNISSSGSLF